MRQNPSSASTVWGIFGCILVTLWTVWFPLASFGRLWLPFGSLWATFSPPPASVWRPFAPLLVKLDSIFSLLTSPDVIWVTLASLQKTHQKCFLKQIDRGAMVLGVLVWDFSVCVFVCLSVPGGSRGADTPLKPSDPSQRPTPGDPTQRPAYRLLAGVRYLIRLLMVLLPSSPYSQLLLKSLAAFSEFGGDCPLLTSPWTAAGPCRKPDPRSRNLCFLEPDSTFF